MVLLKNNLLRRYFTLSDKETIERIEIIINFCKKTVAANTRFVLIEVDCFVAIQ